MKSRVEADIFYKVSEGEMIIHYTYPKDYIRVSNRLGEVKMFFPESNSVFIQNDVSMSSENDVLHYFFFNKISDLGLKEYGFELADTKMDEGVLVSTWKPVNQENQKIRKVLLAHNNNLPVYIAYFDKKDNIVKKVYYSDYIPVSANALPGTIVEITYIEKQDSIVNRKQFLNVESGPQLKDAYFEFKVPQDAKRINELK